MGGGGGGGVLKRIVSMRQVPTTYVLVEKYIYFWITLFFKDLMRIHNEPGHGISNNVVHVCATSNASD